METLTETERSAEEFHSKEEGEGHQKLTSTSKNTTNNNTSSYRSPLEESRREAAILRARRNRKRKKEQIESLQDNVERLRKINQELVCQTQVLGLQLMNARCTIMALEKMLQSQPQQPQLFPYSNLSAMNDSSIGNNTTTNSTTNTAAAAVAPGLFSMDPSHQYNMLQSLQQQQLLLMQSNPMYGQALIDPQTSIHPDMSGNLNVSEGKNPSNDETSKNHYQIQDPNVTSSLDKS